MTILHKGYHRVESFIVDYISIANIDIKPKAIMIKRGDDDDEEYHSLETSSYDFSYETKKVLIKKIAIDLMKLQEGTFLQLIFE